MSKIDWMWSSAQNVDAQYDNQSMSIGGVLIQD
jgi:hypothetical protein